MRLFLCFILFDFYFIFCGRLGGIVLLFLPVFSGAVPRQEEAGRAAATHKGAICATDFV